MTAPDLNIGILLAPEFSALPLAGFLDTLRHAADENDRSRQIYCAWKILSHNLEPIRCSAGVAMLPDTEINFDNIPFDYIAIHGGRLEGLSGIPKGMADLLVDEPRGAHHEVRSYAQGHDSDTDPRVQRAVAAMRTRLGHPVPISGLANECGTSERQLNRLFHQHYGLAPASHRRHIRNTLGLNASGVNNRHQARPR